MITNVNYRIIFVCLFLLIFFMGCGGDSGRFVTAKCPIFATVPEDALCMLDTQTGDLWENPPYGGAHWKKIGSILTVTEQVIDFFDHPSS